ncbi:MULTISPECIES: hypothetical protein [Pseudarthrobacter]|uniref:Sporulation protein YtfJ n=1 Tax=Pseudarthrobacter niigatensis TaxID=369935 RepID=A0AAJ1WIY6_9MICC|nr:MULTISPECIES: hypothetical protein [Pseudarthrobacter]MDQ0148063.1 hypothetical protein [Pseudarthrobacter niigatensis]MDQ0268109.1 hypothetical protein [Pseudarthrobacter niigatensis]QDG87438.1 hypothetical protein NIBR502770_02210 [Pseudarthrobacter sp. NIBRBAC000502770]
MADTLESLAESFKNMGVARAYGAPVNLNGEEMVPVALVSFGFGGGTESGEGASGGGGGGVVVPLGVYRTVNGRTVFRPNTIAALVCLVPLMTATGAAVRKAVRAARK